MSTTKETMRGFLLSCLTEIAEYKYKIKNKVIKNKVIKNKIKNIKTT